MDVDMEFKEIIKKRRSVYSISSASTISDKELSALVDLAMKYTPSAFNSQSQRVVVLLGDSHRKLWDITKDTLRDIVPAAAFASTEKKIDSFRAGHGTILYFDDASVTKGLQASFPLYADNFPVWAEQASGMLQFNIWNLLAEAGLGASLQHYNPLIDSKVKEAFGHPESWRLIAQMPFGTPTEQPAPKAFTDVNNILIID